MYSIKTAALGSGAFSVLVRISMFGSTVLGCLRASTSFIFGSVMVVMQRVIVLGKCMGGSG